jgi:putative hemolysin
MLPRTLVAASFLVALTGCPSGGGSPDPSTASSGHTVPTSAPAGSGPLAMLDPNAARQESWQLEKGPAMFLAWDAQHLRVSAGCRQPSGQMDCEALRFARGGPTVELTAQDRARMAPPGGLVCRKIGNVLTTGRDPRGNEDGFCVFHDGSMISQGSLEFHTLKQ